MDKINYAPIDRFKEASYNPRKSSEERLSLLEASIKTMGFIMPIYVDEQNTILSGHQRLKIAKRVGIKEVPYVVIRGLSDHDKQMFNIMFNAGTNDFYDQQTNANIVNQISVEDLLNSDLKPVTNITIEYEDREVLRKYEIASTAKGAGAIHGMMNKGVLLPIILAGDKIVNGNGRFMVYQKRHKLIPVIRIPEEFADIARNALNKISMEFSVGKELRPFVRYSAYRRARQSRENTGLGTNFKYWSKHKNGADITTKFAATFRRIHGSTLINFGAGNLSERHWLDRLGVQYLDFEPYVCDEAKDRIDIFTSKEVCKTFLQKLKPFGRIDSVFMNYILNSIATNEDVDYVLKIVGLFDTGNTKYWISAKNKQSPNFIEAEGIKTISTSKAVNAFKVSENEVISTAEGKIQRYYDPLEYKRLLQGYFNEVHLAVDGFNLYAYCTKPKRFTREEYETAIDNEFELDYPDGTTMGLSELAKSVLLVEK